MKDEMPSDANGIKEPATAGSCWMVVDDNEDVLDTIALLLKQISGRPVYRFRSAVKALEAFRAAPHSWGLVLTDLEMPGLDGIKLCRAMRSLSSEAKVFLATGSGIITTAEAKHLGFAGLLAKPFTFSALLRMLLAAEVPAPRESGAGDTEAVSELAA